MSEERDYTYQLDPGKKARYNAGPFDTETRKPHYEIEIKAPKHVRDRVEITQVLMGTPPRNCLWVWDVKNNSTWPAFIAIKKDGELIKFSG